jgi:LacI family transcriptional regulator
MTRTTINDIADHVGVDKSTVSLVLRRKKTAMRISQLTQDRIFSAPKDLNYRPNVLARGLKGGQTHSVGIVWDMSVAQASVLMTRDLMVRIQNRQYVPYVIDNQSNFDKTLGSLSEFANRGVDGVIVELPSPNLSD